MMFVAHFLRSIITRVYFSRLHTIIKSERNNFLSSLDEAGAVKALSLWYHALDYSNTVQNMLHELRRFALRVTFKENQLTDDLNEELLFSKGFKQRHSA